MLRIHSQIKVKNRFLKNEYKVEHIEGIDIDFLENTSTQYIPEYPKKIVIMRTHSKDSFKNEFFI